jgi:hypothetical protein
VAERGSGVGPAVSSDDAAAAAAAGVLTSSSASLLCSMFRGDGTSATRCSRSSGEGAVGGEVDDLVKVRVRVRVRVRVGIRVRARVC